MISDSVTENRRKVLTVEEAGEMLGLSRSAAYRAAQAGTIPTIRISPHRLRVPAAALDRLLAGEGTDLR